MIDTLLLTPAVARLLSVVLVSLVLSFIGLFLSVVGLFRLRSWAGERTAMEDILYVAAPRLAPFFWLIAAGVLLQIIALGWWALVLAGVLVTDNKSVIFALAGLAHVAAGALIFRWSLLVGQNSETQAMINVSEKWQRQYR